MARWRSASVSLVLIGAAAGLASCGPSEPGYYRRNVYASKADCYRDYGPRDCEVGYTGYYYGAHYWAFGGARPANDPGAGASAVNGRSQIATAVSDPVRGGFGATGRGYRGSVSGRG